MEHTLKKHLACSHSPITPQETQLHYVELENGKFLFAPFNGCENLNGSTICANCIKRINTVLLSGAITMNEIDTLFIE